MGDSGERRLGRDSIDRLPPQIRVPRYDWRRLETGMAHIGVGAFHRCHQAEYTDDMLEAQLGRWGVVGVNLRPPRLNRSLGAQDGLYTRTLRQGADSDTRVIGCLRRVVDVETPADAATAIAALAAPEIDIITLTLTEKGYCHVPATGALDLSNPDIVHDLAGGQGPRSALGLLTLAFEHRRLMGAGPVTVLSCDNLPANGHLLGGVLTEFSRRRLPAACDWMAANVVFPCSMVDRIVPATSAADLEYVANLLGATDAGVVTGEPFKQWVIEDRFAGRRPPWDIAGAQFVPDVEPFERIKMRILNAAQSTLAHLGALCGHDFSWQAVADPVLGRIVRRMLVEESAATLPAVAGMAVPEYIETTFQRIANTAIHHRCHQIGTDGSQKIRQRLLAPLREQRAAGRPARLLTLAVAGWIAYVVAGAEVFGRRWQPDDPFAPRLIALAQACGSDIPALVHKILRIEEIFAADGSDAALVDDISEHLSGLLSPAPQRYLAGVLGA